MIHPQIAKSRTTYVIVLILITLIVTACGSQRDAQLDGTPEALTAEATPTSASERGTGDTFRIFLWQAPEIINPHLAPGIKDQFVSRIAYEPLATFNNEGTLIPLLADEIPSLENGGLAADGKSVTWKLKENLFWSDGEPFTADDVLFTYEYITNSDIGSSSDVAYSLVESVEVIDDYTVKVNFTGVNHNWTVAFVGIRGMIIPRHVFEDYTGVNYREAPANRLAVGTGPYRVVDFANENILLIGDDVVTTTRIIFEPNPYYRDPDKPYFSRLEVQGGGGEANYAVQVLLADQADFSWQVFAEEDYLSQLEADPNLELVTYTGGGAGTEIMLLNFTDPNRETADGERSSLQYPHPFLSDWNVRQAINLAIDRKALQDIYGHIGTLTSNMVDTPAMYVSPNTSYEYNPEKATALLDEAGWVDSDGDRIRDKDGVALHVLYQTSVNANRQKVQKLIKENLQAIGFSVELQAIDASAFFSSDPGNLNTNSHFYADLQVWAGGSEDPDPTNSWFGLFICDQIPQKANNWTGYNTGRYCNPEFEELYQQASVETDPEKRRELIIAMNDLLIQDVAIIPIVSRLSVNGVKSNLIGYSFTPWDLEVWNIADWRWRE